MDAAKSIVNVAAEGERFLLLLSLAMVHVFAVGGVNVAFCLQPRRPKIEAMGFHVVNTKM